jgi:serine/threonine protein kinase
MTVRKSEIGQLNLLAEGGFGRVYLVPNFFLPNDNTALAYKEFTGSSAQRKQSAKAAVLTAEFRATVSASERVVLDRHYAWPRELVEDDTGQVIGFLMPLVPEVFFFRHMDVKSGLLENKPRDLQWLFATEKQRQEAKLNLPEIRESDRLFLVTQLVYAIAWLHHRGWVFGDVSFRNAAFTLNPPRLMLFDCDGAAAVSDQQREQAHTPFWLPPEFVKDKTKQQDPKSDVYKLGLAIVRCLKSERGASQTRDIKRIAGILDAEGVALVERALAPLAADRPSARDFYKYLQQFTAPKLTPPTVTELNLETPLLLKGAEARILWQLENADEVRIMAGEQQAEVANINVTDHPTGCTFRVTEPGPITVSVDNPYGQVVRAVGDVMLYEIPRFNISLNDLPHPSVPDIAAFSLEPLTRLIPDLPRVPDIPALPSAAAYDLIGHLAGEEWLVPPSRRIDGVIWNGARAIVDLLHVESRRFLAGLRDMTEGQHHV